jgi:hypothetical protein
MKIVNALQFKFKYKEDLYDVDMIDLRSDYPFYTIAFRIPVKNSDKEEGIICRSDEGELFITL